MSFVLKPGHLNILADFCKDLAKGVTLAAILGQGIQSGEPVAKMVLTISWIFIAIMSLLAAMTFSNHERI